MPQNGNNCVSNMKVCTLLSMHRPEIEGKQLLLSQMHDLKVSCTLLVGKKERERKGKEKGAKQGSKEGRCIHRKSKIITAQRPLPIRSQIHLHFVFQRNSPGCLASSFFFWSSFWNWLLSKLFTHPYWNTQKWSKVWRGTED